MSTILKSEGRFATQSDDGGDGSREIEACLEVVEGAGELGECALGAIEVCLIAKPCCHLLPQPSNGCRRLLRLLRLHMRPAAFDRVLAPRDMRKSSRAQARVVRVKLSGQPGMQLLPRRGACLAHGKAINGKANSFERCCETGLERG